MKKKALDDRKKMWNGVVSVMSPQQSLERDFHCLQHVRVRNVYEERPQTRKQTVTSRKYKYISISWLAGFDPPLIEKGTLICVIGTHAKDSSRGKRSVNPDKPTLATK